MRKFSSYGPIDTELHYYAPRTALIDRALLQLIGEDPKRGGHYITVWAPRQTGKTWIMQQVLARLRDEERFDAVKINLQHLMLEADLGKILQTIARELLRELGQTQRVVNDMPPFQELFSREVLTKPLILLLDEFDALPEAAISALAGIFRNMYIHRRDDANPSARKKYLLHGVALIGVRSVLGIENVTGSPFNVQRSLHVPNLTYDEVEGMFAWYTRESGQPVEQNVIERLYDETRGHPGLTCWFGELLTEGFEDYRPPQNAPITVDVFTEVYGAATHILPNNTILNIISKAKQAPYKSLVLKLFQTDETLEFTYHNHEVNFLYMNGVITQDKLGPARYGIKFSCPFVQKSLFQYFANDLFKEPGKLYDVFEDLEDTITDEALNIRSLLRRYEGYLRTNREWLLRDAPRRADLRIYEAVYHFNLYMYLYHFLNPFGGRVYPEFPTGNGKIDLILQYAGHRYGLEIKSFSTHKEYQTALHQAAHYGSQLHLAEIALVVFVDHIDEANRHKYEQGYTDSETGVSVLPVFVETGQ